MLQIVIKDFQVLIGQTRLFGNPRDQRCETHHKKVRRLKQE